MVTPIPILGVLVSGGSMKIIKVMHSPMTVAVIVLFVFFIQTPLQAVQERRGSTVVVTLADGSRVEGELLAVKEEVLLVYDKKAAQGKSIDLRQVTQVKLLKKSKILAGVGIGLALGILGGFVINKTSGGDQEMAGLFYVYYLPQTALAGGIIGAVLSKPAYFDFAGVQLSNMWQDLRSLKQYARESDTDFNKDLAVHQ
jgi:hypothetical protein